MYYTELTGSTLSPEETAETILTLGPIGYPFHLVNQWNYIHHGANWIEHYVR